MNSNLKMGSLLFRSKGIVVHVGIYLGFNRVMHSVPETGIAIVGVKEFSAGKNVRVVKAEDVDELTLSARIKELVSGNTEYSLSDRNCQHIANYILTGRKKSPQLRWSVASASIAGLLALGNNKNPLPYLAFGGLFGCLAYSLSLQQKGCLVTSDIGSNLASGTNIQSNFPSV